MFGADSVDDAQPERQPQLRLRVRSERSVGASLAAGDRENLCREDGLALTKRLNGGVVGRRPPQLHAVTDVETLSLASLLHQTDHLADRACTAKLVGELQVQRDGLVGR